MMAVALALASCTADEDAGGDRLPGTDVRLAFSLPQRIVASADTEQQDARATGTTQTRMTDDVVQYRQTADAFRGLADVVVLSYAAAPDAVAKATTVNALPATYGAGSPGFAVGTDYALDSHLQLPVGTTHLAFYGRAADQPLTHAERMHYGCSEAVAIAPADYAGNADVRFRPVPICTADGALGGSQRGQALLHLLNDLLNSVADTPAPDNQWPTATDAYLRAAYRALTALRTSSSYNVQTMLGTVWHTVNRVSPATAGYPLAQLLAGRIADACATTPDTQSDHILLDDRYQGFPADLHLPDGAARIVWNADEHRFDFPDAQAYGKGLNVASPASYCYPINLHYHVVSPIVASDSLLLAKQLVVADTLVRYSGWQQMVDSLYADGAAAVQPSTQSVAMTRQVQYAVGRLSVRAHMASGTLYDARGHAVDTSAGFTLKGYIVGGQREVDYAFQPVPGTPDHAIYSTDLNGGTQRLVHSWWTPVDHILGFATAADQPVYLAMELVNDGPAFQGADGEIVHGATFYLVAGMVPAEGTNYSAGSLDRIFRKDYATEVNLTINNGWADTDGDGRPDPDLDEHGNPKPITGLATATYGLPDVGDITSSTSFGLSVNLSWKDGIHFENEF